MGKNEGTLRKITKHIPFADSVLSLAQELGISKVLLLSLGLVGSLFVTVWAWMWSNLPPWGLFMVAIGGLSLFLWLISSALNLWIGYKQAGSIEEIDRIKLADQAQELGHRLLALSAEHQGAISAGWMADCETNDFGEKSKRNAAVGKLIEKYGERHAGAAWSIVAAADKIIPIDYSRKWRVGLVTTGEQSPSDMGHFLIEIASELRHGTPERETNG